MDKVKIAWLWLIRHEQPTTIDNLITKLDEGTLELPITLPDFEYPSYLARSAEYEIGALLAAGLITTADGKPPHGNSKFRLTPAMSRAQDFFSISLTQTLTRSDSAIFVDPLFGKPAQQGAGGQWARIFVAMPFSADLKPIYTDHIRPVADALGISCKRGDDFFTAHSIMNDVWSALYHAELCIVDCTNRNPNVFYELGIAHTLGRKSILIAQSIEDIPFDVRHLRTIIYEYTPPGMKQFEETLKMTIRTELGLTGDA